MAISLYASLIPSFQQIVGSVAGLIDKAEAHCAEQNIAPEEIIQGRLIKDMLPFTYQVKAVAEHSAGAIEAIICVKALENQIVPPTINTKNIEPEF